MKHKDKVADMKAQLSAANDRCALVATERDALKAQMNNAVGPVLAGAKAAVEKIRTVAICAATDWAVSGGYRFEEVSGLAGAIEDALESPYGAIAVQRQQFGRRVAEAVAAEYERKLNMTGAGSLDIDLDEIVEGVQ